MKHRYAAGDGKTYVFTNRGSSGVTKNDGKLCVIESLKTGAFWNSVLDEPGYSIRFLESSLGFGCRESELKLQTQNTGDGHDPTRPSLH